MPKEKKLVEVHPSLTIVQDSQKRFLMSVYDSGYRKGKGPYPLTANVIGGNPDINEDDKSPEEVLIREVKEEFDSDYQIKNPQTNVFGQRVSWAPQKEIAYIRDAILDSIQPFQDFYVRAESFCEGTSTYQGLYSYFKSLVPEKVIDLAISNIRRHKSLVTEGLVGVFTLGELESDSRKELTTAHMTAPALNQLFDADIPYPPQLKAEPIGIPRNSFQDYLSDFEYSKIKKPNHNDPSKTDPSFYEAVFGKE